MQKKVKILFQTLIKEQFWLASNEHSKNSILTTNNNNNIASKKCGEYSSEQFRINKQNNLPTKFSPSIK